MGDAVDRRTLRRQQTVEEILDRALEIMATDGVAGLTMTRLARSVSMQPPSLYKYFDSSLAVYEALFAQGQRDNLATVRAAAGAGDPGLDALRRALVAAGRWAVEHPVLAQLLFWRPVPGFVPSPEAMAPAGELEGVLRGVIRDAVRLGQLGRGAASERGLTVLAILHFGVIGLHLANDPGSEWSRGRYTRRHTEMLDLFVLSFPPPTG